MVPTLLWPLGHLLWKHWPRGGAVLPLPDPSRVTVLDPLMVQVTPESFLRSLDGPILAIWVLSSAVLLILFVFLLIRTRRLRKGWTGEEAYGQPVLFSPDQGPAVVGFISPQIVLPTWCKELEDQTLRLILDHESEHLKAGDLRLILTAGALTILFPWHLPFWWQFQRLRVAVEGDCDLRVLRKYPERTRPYMELLLQVGSRNPRVQALAAMLSESEETLERRIRIMTMPFPKKPWIRGVLLAVFGGVLVAVAAWAPSPTDIQAEEVELPAVELPPPLEAVAVGDADEIQAEGANSSFTPFTDPPELQNRAEVLEALEREYPPLLKDAGIGGTTMVWFYVEETGRVTRIQIDESSGHKALDDAALKVAAIVEFTPARDGAKPVPAWISLPITFAVAGGPTFTPFTDPPDIKNRSEVVAALEREYPPLLRDAGIAGTVDVWFYLDETGRVIRVQVDNSSGHKALDDAAIRVAEIIDFTPALNRDKPVPVWISLPITFTTAGGAKPEPEEEPPEVEGVQDPIMESAPTFFDIPAEDLPPPPERSEKDISAAPTFTPFTVKPDIKNRAEILRALERAYPPLLRDAGVGGTVDVWFFIDDQGVVQRTAVDKTSGHQALDEAALEVAGVIEFTAALNRDKRVPVWISLPITFTTR